MKNREFYIAAAILISTYIILMVFVNRQEPKVVSTNLENIPQKILQYVGTEDTFSKGVYDELNADKHIYRHYRSESGKLIDLYIGYYGTKKGGRTAHNPFGCLPGSGWAIIKTDQIALKPKYYQKEVRVNYIISKKGELYNSILHWYQSDYDKILTTGIQQNISRFINRIIKNKNDGAFVRISMISNKSEIKKAKKNISKFSTEILNLLPKYWPIEK